MLDPRKRRRFDAVVWSVSLAFAIVFPFAAAADGHRYANDHAAYRAECGSCHIAYPPALLNAEGWNAIMNSLDRHFGTDASISDAKRAELAAYLGTAASPRKSAGTTRITDAAWFRKEHREISAVTWKSSAVKSPSNCEACHREASIGDFSERNIHIPREGSK
ncbi:MAG TPA: cytochrome C [Burkholderiaceae bacterium]|nr:cytochrome C [Burkholderiaceae bacterium]